MAPALPSPAHDAGSHRKPALKLVRTQSLDRNQWLAVRKRGIGSSDAAAAVGLNPYKSQLELWMEKTGRDADLPKIDLDDDSTPTYWGSLLEHIVAAQYTRRTGNRVRRLNSNGACRAGNPALPRLQRPARPQGGSARRRSWRCLAERQADEPTHLKISANQKLMLSRAIVSINFRFIEMNLDEDANASKISEKQKYLL